MPLLHTPPHPPNREHKHSLTWHTPPSAKKRCFNWCNCKRHSFTENQIMSIHGMIVFYLSRSVTTPTPLKFNNVCETNTFLALQLVLKNVFLRLRRPLNSSLQSNAHDTWQVHMSQKSVLLVPAKYWRKTWLESFSVPWKRGLLKVRVLHSNTGSHSVQL